MEVGLNVLVMIVIILVMLLIFAIVAYCYITHATSERVELRAELDRAKRDNSFLADDISRLMCLPEEIKSILDEDMTTCDKLSDIELVINEYFEA